MLVRDILSYPVGGWHAWFDSNIDRARSILLDNNCLKYYNAGPNLRFKANSVNMECHQCSQKKSLWDRFEDKDTDRF